MLYVHSSETYTRNRSFCCSSKRYSKINFFTKSGLRVSCICSVLSTCQYKQMTNKVFHLYQGFSTQQSNTNANICAMCPNKLAPSYQDYMYST